MNLPVRRREGGRIRESPRTREGGRRERGREGESRGRISRERSSREILPRDSPDRPIDLPTDRSSEGRFRILTSETPCIAIILWTLSILSQMTTFIPSKNIIKKLDNVGHALFICLKLLSYACGVTVAQLVKCWPTDFSARVRFPPPPALFRQMGMGGRHAPPTDGGGVNLDFDLRLRHAPAPPS